MPNKNSSQIATNSKWWADCPEHGNDKFPSGSCHECAMLQPPPAEDTATKAVVALGRIASGKHENGEPLTAQQAFVIARLAIQSLQYIPEEAWEYFERHDLKHHHDVFLIRGAGLRDNNGRSAEQE